MLDPHGIILSWNSGAEQLFGYQAHQIIGKSIDCLYPTKDSPWKTLEDAASQGPLTVREWQKCSDGMTLWAQSTVTPIYHPESKALIGYSKSIRDLSDEGETKEALKASLKELADIKFALAESTIVAMTDKQGLITYANDAFCKISKYSREELLGKDHRIVNSGFHPTAFFKDMWQTIGQGKVWRGEVRNKAKDGSIYWVDTTIVPFLDAEEKPYQYVAIRHDISDLKRIEAEMRLLNEELEQRVSERTSELQSKNKVLGETLAQLQESEKLRSTFISALTHDLRTPLVAQKRALELFQGYSGSLPPRLSGLSDRLLKSNDGLLEMVNLLLETYQFEAGKNQPLLEDTNLYVLTADCFSEVASLAEVKQIKLENNIAQTLPSVLCDAQQLRRVWMNLLGNALENIPDGSLIQFSAQEIKNGFEICIEDNGPGIPPEALPHLFKRYYTGDKTRKKIGSGLGLYICHMIMELHDGSIHVESILGQGTRFTLNLPKQSPKPSN